MKLTDHVYVNQWNLWFKIENQSDKAYDLFLEEFEKLVKLTDLFQTNGIFVR